jgi:DNA-binding LacI/PurR family transcriptional regulator
MQERAMNQSEIAEKVGLSQTAVSLVLNNPQTTKVSSAKKQLIREYLQKNSYINQASVRRTWNIGFVLNAFAESTSDFYHRFVEGIEQAADKTGYSFFLEFFRDDEPNIIRKNKVDGIICGSAYLAYFERQKQVPTIPVVLLNTTDLGMKYDSVMPDNAGSMFYAVEHLVALGHERIAFLALLPGENSPFPPGVMANYHERLHGFKSACEHFKIKFDDENYIQIPRLDKIKNSFEKVNDILKMWRRLKTPPSAVVCSNDGYATYLRECALNMGLNLPGDLSIIGIDNKGHSIPGGTLLSTVDQNFCGMGRLAVELLVKRIGDPRGLRSKVCCKSTLIVRDSTGPFENEPKRKQK